jgi:hypothetical protein
MSDRSVVIIGLPGSGKTTFLAALWHLITERDLNTLLRFHTLINGDVTHLNEIAARWREAKVQERTAIGGSRMVSMNLLDTSDLPVRVTFPDVPGEAYRRMWEERECESELARILKAGGIMLFIHSDAIVSPNWVVDEIKWSNALGLELEPGIEIPWHPKLAPTQVQLVDLLQLLRAEPLDVGPRKLAIMLSAWDKASSENLTPQTYLATKLPLLFQYLRSESDGWEYRIYGLSAQGCDYDSTEPESVPKAEAESARNLDQPSTRIKLIADRIETHDITEPLVWLME